MEHKEEDIQQEALLASKNKPSNITDSNIIIDIPIAEELRVLRLQNQQLQDQLLSLKQDGDKFIKRFISSNPSLHFPILTPKGSALSMLFPAQPTRQASISK